MVWILPSIVIGFCAGWIVARNSLIEWSARAASEIMYDQIRTWYVLLIAASTSEPINQNLKVAHVLELMKDEVGE